MFCLGAIEMGGVAVGSGCGGGSGGSNDKSIVPNSAGAVRARRRRKRTGSDRFPQTRRLENLIGTGARS